MADPEFPDLFADALTVSYGPYGVALTLLLTDPLAETPNPSMPGRIVGRVRLSPDLARALRDLLAQGLENIPQPQLSLDSKP